MSTDAAVRYAEVAAGRYWLDGLAEDAARSFAGIRSEPTLVGTNIRDVVFAAQALGVTCVGGTGGAASGPSGMTFIGAGGAAPGGAGVAFIGAGGAAPNLGVLLDDQTSVTNQIAGYSNEQVTVNAAAFARTYLAMSGTFAGQLGFVAGSAGLVEVCAGCTAAPSAPSAVVDPAPTLTRALRALESRRSVLSARQFEALQRQLRALLEDERELNEAGISISFASLHGLIDFIAGNDARAHPNLSITRDGYFAASWSPRKRAKLTLTFRGEGQGEWVSADLDTAPPTTSKGEIKDLPAHFEHWMTAA